jgi:hypothetical protein
MNQNVILSMVELAVSLVIEGVILSMIFNWISNKSQQKLEQKLEDFIIAEVNNVEKQNKYIYEQLETQINNAKIDIISQIKESSEKK